MTAESQHQDPGSDAPAEATPGLPGQLDSPLILVVDDDKLNRVVMSAVLRQLGYRFTLATNGREAVEAVRRERYAAVLMDCLMPEMDGYEATATIRRHERLHPSSDGAHRHVPIIAVTAVAIQGARERCISAGMDDYVTKPVVLQSVAGVLERWLAGPAADATWAPELAAAEDESEDDAIDGEALDALRQLDPAAGETLIAEVVHDFSVEVPPSFDLLRAAVVAGDAKSVVQQLHFIAGCASIVGATHVERLARSLESAQPHDAPAMLQRAAALVDDLEEAFVRARVTLESIVALSDLKAPGTSA